MKSFSDYIKEIKENPYLLIFYVKPSCNKCWGKGYLSYNSPDASSWKIFCSCVEKSIKKEIKNYEYEK